MSGVKPRGIGTVMAGNLILGCYTAFLAAIASRTGLSTHLLARYSFGEKGSYLPSLLLGITQVSWFGVGVAMFAMVPSEPMGLFTAIGICVASFISGGTLTPDFIRFSRNTKEVQEQAAEYMRRDILDVAESLYEVGCGMPMTLLPPIGCSTRCAKALVEIGKADGL